MDLFEAMEHRHAVRSYEDRPIAPEAREALLACIAQCNRESGLHIQLVLDEPRGFGGLPAHYGKFSGVKNYIALIGKKSPNLEEACGYYGEKIVLRAQQLGLNTCWVAMTYSKVKTAFQIAPGEKLCLVIAVGHGTTQGAGHPVKQPEEVSKADSPVPDWFQRGVRAALLAPTAMNQQKFTFTLQGGSVAAKAGTGFYTKVDLGIAKYHFEIGAGTAQFRWASASVSPAGNRLRSSRANWGVADRGESAITGTKPQANASIQLRASISASEVWTYRSAMWRISSRRAGS